jgi:hypothetical protein
VHPALFGLHEDGFELDLDPEWRTLVHQQARMLAAMLQRIQTAAGGVLYRIDTSSLQALAADAERLLAAQARQHVTLECELEQLRVLVTDLGQAPVELTQRLQRLERVLVVLHANLTVARRTIAMLTQEPV